MVTKIFEDKIVLISGGAGSLGRRLVKELIKPKYNVKVVRVLDINENNLAKLQLELKDDKIRLFIGDIRDKERMKRAMENVDIYLHCAALKRVEMCEYNPFESIMTNVVGTQNCIDIALNVNISHFIFISSDKAVYPSNVYGKCKSLAESLVLDAENYKGDKKTKFSVCRPPNYLHSDGSVFDVWNYQKTHGIPLTVTDERMERFFMSFSEIVDFIIKCLNLMEGGEIFVPIGARKTKIIDLAKQISDNIKIIGVRKGERLTEFLYTEEEIARAERKNGIWVIRS